MLGRRNVPLQPLEDQHVGVAFAGAKDVGVDLLDADPGVLGAAVVGDDDPVQAVCRGVLDLVLDPVEAVGGVLGVDVVIAGQPHGRLPLGVLAAALGRGGRRHPADSGQTCGDGTGTGQAGALQQPAAREIARGEFGVRDGRIAGGAEIARLVRVVTVVVPGVCLAVRVVVAVRVSVVVRSTHR